MFSAEPVCYPGAVFMDDRRTSPRFHKHAGGAQRCFCDSVQFLALAQAGVRTFVGIKCLHRFAWSPIDRRAKSAARLPAAHSSPEGRSPPTALNSPISARRQPGRRDARIPDSGER
jgi:hypothetical protein